MIYMRGYGQGELFREVYRRFTAVFDHRVENVIDGLLDFGAHRFRGITRKHRTNHTPNELYSLNNTTDYIYVGQTDLWCPCSGGSISTNVGLCFAASFPPAFNSGNPGRVRTCHAKISINLNRRRNLPTLERRLSVTTLQTSLCLVTSHAWLPSHSSTLETGSVALRRAYSTGGSVPESREKGNFGTIIIVVSVV